MWAAMLDSSGQASVASSVVTGVDPALAGCVFVQATSVAGVSMTLTAVGDQRNRHGH